MVRRAIPAVLALAVLASAAGAGCKRKKDAGRDMSIEVGRITVSWVDVMDEMEVERDPVKEKRLRRMLATRIEEHPRIRAGVAGRDPLDLSVVSGGELPPLPGGADASVDDAFAAPGDEIVAFTLSTTWKDGWKISSTVLTALEEGADGAGPVLDDLLGDLVDQIGLFDLGPEALVALVGERDCRNDGVCSTAVRILGERRERSAVPALVGLLRSTASTDPLTEDLVGALGRIGDERASAALVDAFNRAHPVQQPAILHALSRTGGNDARLFLEVVATGHESPLLREQAAAALATLDAQ